MAVMRRWHRVILACFVILVIFVSLLYSELANPALLPHEPVARLISINQGWSKDDAEAFHYTAQGTFLLPLSWLQSLEAGFFTSKKLTDSTILDGLRFLTDGAAKDREYNRAGLPIGWASACWIKPQVAPPTVQASDRCNVTTQRANTNIGFNCAACHTSQLNYHGVGIRIDGGGSMADLDTFQEMVGKAILATELLPWKRSRFIAEVSGRTGLPPTRVGEQLHGAFEKAVGILTRSLLKPLYPHSSYGRLDALQRIANTLFADDLNEPDNNRQGNAPVKYPYLWDIWRLDWAQYNGSVRQPMMRNVGEALGVKAQTVLVDAEGVPNSPPGRWNSSVMTDKLFWMETTLQRLTPPKWPSEILGPINRGQAMRGELLFTQRCASCHGIHVDVRTQPVEWKVTMVPLDVIGTDPNAAMNFSRNTYTANKLGRDKIDGATGLKLVTTEVKDYQYTRLGLTAAQRATWDGFGRGGDVRAPLAYKARPLVGIWASPPYLHNGSVPTLYDLLSPTRPARFSVGSRQYDPIKVGFDVRDGGATFDTGRSGNSNKGHWFVDDDRVGKLGPAFGESDRMAIIEYLKAATYANYPCNDANAPDSKLSGPDCGQ